MRREGDDAGAVVELHEANRRFVHETGGLARCVEPRHFDAFFSVRNDRAGEVVEFGKLVRLAHVFQRALVILGREEVIAFLEPEALADVLEGIGVGPADPDRFFGEGKGLQVAGVDGVFGFDPVDLVWQEKPGEGAVGVNR